MASKGRTNSYSSCMCSKRMVSLFRMFSMLKSKTFLLHVSLKILMMITKFYTVKSEEKGNSKDYKRTPQKLKLNRKGTLLLLSCVRK
jgi:hypothetical protein